MPQKVPELLEKDIQKQCLGYLEALGIFHWRQNSGAVTIPGTSAHTRRFIRFNTKKGMSDIIGILPQDEVLKDGTKARFGNLLAIEVKRPGKKPTPDQEEFLKAVNEQGGVAFVVHSVDELKEEMARFL